MSARERVLDYLENQATRPMTEAELAREFDITTDQRHEFKELLEDLQQAGVIHKNKAGQYGVPDRFDLIVGRIERNRKGFGFLIPEDPEQEDVFISLENMNGAMHNDKVFVRALPSSRGKRVSGEVIEVVERANHQIVGNLDKSKYFGFVIPDNQRIYSDVFIPEKELHGARQGQKVVAEIISWPAPNRNPEGRIIETLGYKDEPGVDIEAIIRQLELPRDFPKGVKKEASSISMEIPESEIADRRDLRQLPMFTIDGEDAKDFDDAVSIERLDEDTVRLGVHIADVSHYVKEDSPLDNEASERGTSIYLVDRVIPMLPERLSNGICSLRPEEDRLAMTVFMDYQLDPLDMVDYQIFSSVIRSNYRLTYDQVRRILVEKDNKLRQEYSDIVDKLELMNKLREAIRDNRFAEGSINFEFPEVKVILDEKGHPLELRKRKHGIPEQLIEEFMIAANRTVATDIYWKDIPFIYRVHDQPDPDRLHSFNEFIHNFGYHLKGIRNQIHPAVLQELLQEVEGEPEEAIIDNVLLRSMKKVVYSTNNIGHFGLALDCYTHFTSPIRRYPDLIVHRILKEVLEQGMPSENRREHLKEKLPGIAEHSSFQERKALEAERDSVDLKKLEFMQDKVGYEYTGIISGMTGFGFFVQLENTVEGLVHVEELKDDYYHFREDQQALIGERTKKIYRLGDEVNVKVDRVNLDERELDFVLAESD
ncbi:MAG: ribonuclease R [Bacillota bacterium]